MSRIRIVIADDHAVMREGLSALVTQRGIMVEGVAENGHEAVEKCMTLKPDVVLMDISMPDLNGADATVKINKRLPDTRVIALSMHSDRQRVSRMFNAGAFGYLLKESALDEIITAIEAVHQGNFYLTPSLAHIYAKGVSPTGVFRKGQFIAQGFIGQGLSLKEREILQLVSEGYKTREIGDKLGISIRTVETHRRHIMTKLNIFSVAGLTRFAIREGIVSME